VVKLVLSYIPISAVDACDARALARAVLARHDVIRTE
jgi:hypothetical protein